MIVCITVLYSRTMMREIEVQSVINTRHSGSLVGDSAPGSRPAGSRIAPPRSLLRTVKCSTMYYIYGYSTVSFFRTTDDGFTFPYTRYMLHMELTTIYCPNCSYSRQKVSNPLDSHAYTTNFSSNTNNEKKK